jgi:hypothetical protein
MATTTAQKPGQRRKRGRKGPSQRIAFDRFTPSPFDALALMLWRSHGHHALRLGRDRPGDIDPTATQGQVHVDELRVAGLIGAFFFLPVFIAFIASVPSIIVLPQ